MACPVPDCLAVRPPLTRRWVLRPVVATAMALVVYFGIVGGFRLAGHWHTTITEAEYHQRLPHVGSGAYTHPGGSRMTRSSDAAAPFESDGTHLPAAFSTPESAHAEGGAR